MSREKVITAMGWDHLAKVPAPPRQALALSGDEMSNEEREMREGAGLYVPDTFLDRSLALSGNDAPEILNADEKRTLPARVKKAIHELVATTTRPVTFHDYCGAERRLRQECVGERDSGPGMHMLGVAMRAWARECRYELPANTY